MSYESEILQKITRQDLNIIGIRALLYGLNSTTAVLLKVDSNGVLHIQQIGAAAITSGRKAIATAGTRERLVANSTPCFRVDVYADLGNTNPVVIGGSGVIAASGSQEGIVLIPGNDPVTIYIDDVTKLWADVQTNGDAVCFNYYTY